MTPEDRRTKFILDFYRRKISWRHLFPIFPVGKFSHAINSEFLASADFPTPIIPNIYRRKIFRRHLFRIKTVRQKSDPIYWEFLPPENRRAVFIPNKFRQIFILPSADQRFTTKNRARAVLLFSRSVFNAQLKKTRTPGSNPRWKWDKMTHFSDQMKKVYGSRREEGKPD